MITLHEVVLRVEGDVDKQYVSGADIRSLAFLFVDRLVQKSEVQPLALRQNLASLRERIASVSGLENAEVRSRLATYVRAAIAAASRVRVSDEDVVAAYSAIWTTS